MADKIFPAILCGGSGTRLWPLSRRSYPKQLLNLTGDSSLLEATARRLGDADMFHPPVAISGDAYRFLVAEQMRQAGIEPSQIILEPVGRNTAPAAATAALWSLERDPDAVVLLSPSDHLVRNDDALLVAVSEAAEFARKTGALVVFGVEPSGAETGYGYIEVGEHLANSPHGTVRRVERFTEKPDAETATAYLQRGGFLWNSGLFLFRARDLLDEMERHEPDIVASCTEALAVAEKDLDFLRLDEPSFRRCPANSLDYAVMEKTDKAAVIKVDMGWSDVGSWSALHAMSQKDSSGNSIAGDVVAINSHNNLVRSESQLVVASGVDDLIIVATKDATLVATQDAAGDLKEVVAGLEHLDRDVTDAHARVHRPWGWFETMDEGPGFKVKRIAVKPHHKLSLQKHRHRAEHWVVVTGTAKITRDGEIFRLAHNQSTYIPAGVTHRLENEADAELHIIEVQSGAYLGEDDIERLDDVYGRR